MVFPETTGQFSRTGKSGRLADAHPGSFAGSGDRFVTREMAIMTEDMGPLVDYHMNDIFGNHLSNTVG